MYVLFFFFFFLFYFRNILGTKTLSELLSERDTIAKDLKSMIDTATDPWGIDVRILNSKPLLIINNAHVFRLRELK